MRQTIYTVPFEIYIRVQMKWMSMLSIKYRSLYDVQQLEKPSLAVMLNLFLFNYYGMELYFSTANGKRSQLN